MAGVRDNSIRDTTWGDTAVDGLLAGIFGGLGMMALLVLVGWLRGMSPGQSIALFDPTGTGSPLTGGLAHLATAGIYGIIFGLIMRPFDADSRPRLLLAGVLYGMVIWFAASVVVVPVSDSALASLPRLDFMLAHVLYGLILGWRAAGSKQKGSG